ncbi:class II aldolase/adducin family protein [Micromonospora tulbaghiae]|uniref:Class II aldolase/adducin family protein n=1 Tax=Micromonospora tulbaghiae TaxID=479978 RepID=A0AAW4JIB4_9ACTN|nr:class II aldolase/adducin family protein [Micromonospora tulbaghiae]MBO4139755.1 class II aldolase/adducin family protein [Micromonospora tulbaghiae]SCF01732.1 Rhamnose utilisation protein RhaD, predicted bifunctional aldolase and dehydrogenase [Micromonospora tulbaghiae]
MSSLINVPTTRAASSPGAVAGSPTDEVLRRSHLVGGNLTLTRAGGGNFSAKGVVGDVPVLWMSSWGCDGAATTAEDFPALRLDDLLELRHAVPLDGPAMVERIAATALTADQRPPGIETLTHAFLPAAHVDHCHPDAVISLTCIPDGRERAAAEFGDEAIWFDYRQFDMGVAQELADRVAAQPGCRFVLLANHGIFTWADTSDQCYRNSLEAVARARRALGAAARGRPGDLGGSAVRPLVADQADDLLDELLPVLRGAMREDRRGIVLSTDTSPDAVRFVSSVRGPELTQAGPGCPDSLVTVGYRPLALTPTDLTAEGVRGAIRRYRSAYAAMFERHADAAARRHGPRRDLPRVVLLPGLGVVAGGADPAQAAICAEHFAQTRSVIEAADAAGGYRSLTERQGIADEYWPLMRLKPLLRTAPGRLAGSVVLVAGATEATGRVVADLHAAGANVALAGGGEPSRPDVVHLRARLSAPDAVVREAVRAFGGFDVLVDLTGVDDRLLHAAAAVFARQGTPGIFCTAEPTGGRVYDGEHVDVLVEEDLSMVAERIIVAATEPPQGSTEDAS